MKTLSRITALVLCLIFLLCSCKNTQEDLSSQNSGDSSTESSASEQTDSSGAEISSEQTVNSEFSNQITTSPENPVSSNSSSSKPSSATTPSASQTQTAGLKNEEGSEVKVEEIKAQTGKANGIDVSKWQEVIDWQKVKASGVEFAVIRIGYRAENGKIYKDENADYNIQQADKAGILVGVYFFSTAINTAEALEEAKWTAEAIKSYPISYPVAYDCEGYLSSNSRMFGLSNTARTDNAISFLSHMVSLGYEGMLYASKSELEQHWEISRIEAKYKIWIARYPQVPYPKTAAPDYSGKYHMWQYTNNGKVNGISGGTDLVVSYFTKSKASPKSQQTVTEAEKPKPIDTTYTAVNEQVTAKVEVSLRDAATTNSNVVGTLKKGTFLTRTAIGSNGWSKLSFNGKTVFAVSSYLTTDAEYTQTTTPSVEDGFTAVNDRVTAKSETNLRSLPTTDEGSEILGLLKNGEFLTRTGKSDKGWSRLEYNGKTVYAVTDFLTDESGTQEEREIIFTKVNEQVTAKSETNLRSLPTTDEGSEVLGLLKNGEFLTRTGTSAQGWSRLEYNGKTVYAVSSLLTTEVKPNE